MTGYDKDDPGKSPQFRSAISLSFCFRVTVVSARSDVRVRFDKFRPPSRGRGILFSLYMKEFHFAGDKDKSQRARRINKDEIEPSEVELVYRGTV